MVKHTQTIRRQKPANYLSVFDHFVGFALKRLIAALIPTKKLRSNYGKVSHTIYARSVNSAIRLCSLF